MTTPDGRWLVEDHEPLSMLHTHCVLPRELVEKLCASAPERGVNVTIERVVIDGDALRRLLRARGERRAGPPPHRP